MKRVFIALKIDPGEVLLRIHSSMKSLLGNEKITWVDPSNIHLTLAFLGDTQDDLIKVLSIMLRQKCTGFGEFNFTLAGTGLFKDLRDPRVIWTGIELSDKLMNLSNLINTGLKDAGFKTEDRPFSPHITLGRIKVLRDREALKSVLEKYREIQIQEVHVKEVILYESILKPTGPVYRSIGKFAL